jgi:hypothetical protein
MCREIWTLVDISIKWTHIHGTGSDNHQTNAEKDVRKKGTQNIYYDKFSDFSIDQTMVHKLKTVTVEQSASTMINIHLAEDNCSVSS